MKIGFLKKAVLISLFSLSLLMPAAARTVLVHSPHLGEEPPQELKLSSQSAEAGIMDVLFNRGCIVFSDSTELDLKGLQMMSQKTDSDYAIDWVIEDYGLKGRLISTEDMTVLNESRISRSDFNTRYASIEELYTVLGTRLCEMLVGEQW
ncbi:MAG: hypothetical protein PQJ58_05770 [Spirochaetales bacterium]|nr:hypothetical protein [Spirochaetales bacterium]